MNPWRVRALVEAELHAMRREKLAIASLGLVCVVAGAMGPIGRVLGERYRSAGEEDPGKIAAYACEPGIIPPTALAGEAPAWLRWPDPWAAPEAAELLLTVDGREIELLPLDPKAPTLAAADCLAARVAEERRARLDALGVTEAPGTVVELRTLPPEPREIPPRTPLSAGISILGGVAAVLGAFFADLGPRARASGWLETLVSLPGSRADIIAAWTALGLGAATVATAVVLVADRVAAALTGMPTALVPLGLLPPLLFVLVAIAVRAWLDAADLRAAAIQLVPVVLVVLLLAALARVVDDRLPGLGGAVPVGGLLLSIGARAKGAALAVLTSVAAGGLLLYDSVRVLDGTVVRSGPMGATSLRRAAGDYRPEAILLVLIAIAGSAGWAPPEMLLPDPVLQTLLAMGLYFATPALLVSAPLRLDRRELLSWRAPPLRAWLLAPLILAGSLSLGSLMWRLGARLFPDQALLGALEQALGGFGASVLGLFVVSVVPGVCEELLFRGAILGLLRKRLGDPSAVLLQAAAFALLHGFAIRLPHTFALGLLFGLLTLRTGSLWPAILVHAAHNLSASLLPPERLVAWGAEPAAYGVAAVGIAAAWLAGRRR